MATDFLDLAGTALLEKGDELLRSNPTRFMCCFRELIKCGEGRCNSCKLLLDMLNEQQQTAILLDTDAEQTVAHLASAFHDCVELILYILDLCPSLAIAQRTGTLEGQNFLHILAAKENIVAIKIVLNGVVLDNDTITQCLQARATGERFANTVLMGETVLSVAVLILSTELICLLLDFSVPLAEQNSRGDTVLHTLVRYAHVNPDKEDDVMQMLEYLYETMLTPPHQGGTNWGKRFAKTVWFTENQDKETPLQLAVKLGESNIFQYIMNLQWVYCVLDDFDGLYDTNKYDITEIDTVAKMEWMRVKLQDESWTLSKPKSSLAPFKNIFCCQDSYLSRQGSPAILETVCETDINVACAIISSPIIHRIIQNKWKAHRILFYIWTIFHLVFMASLTIYSQHKVLLIETLQLKAVMNETSAGGNFSRNHPMLASSVNQTSSSYNHEFVTGFCGFLFAPLLLYLYIEMNRIFVQRKPWQLHLIHHNGAYRLLLLIMTLSLLIDNVWYFVSPVTNHKGLIVLALCTGWWFTLFFLRPFHRFSLFTVMLQKVLFGDMFRFATLICLQLLIFTVVMQIIFLHAQPSPPELENFPISLLTMFKLMLGLGDLSILREGKPFWLAVILFVTFVLLTYVLLMNALIAMMSNTCSNISSQKTKLWQIQVLSVILFLEQMLITFGLARTTGRKNYIVKFGNEQEIRYVIEETKGLTQSVDGANITKQNMYIREHEFGVQDLRDASAVNHSARIRRNNNNILLDHRAPSSPFLMRSKSVSNSLPPIPTTFTTTV